MLQAAEVKAQLRPQEPKPPFPYLSRELNLRATDGALLAGTLTLPEGSRPFLRRCW